jgi:hypothetical protein
VLDNIRTVNEKGEVTEIKQGALVDLEKYQLDRASFLHNTEEGKAIVAHQQRIDTPEKLGEERLALNTALAQNPLMTDEKTKAAVEAWLNPNEVSLQEIQQSQSAFVKGEKDAFLKEQERLSMTRAELMKAEGNWPKKRETKADQELVLAPVREAAGVKKALERPASKVEALREEREKPAAPVLKR